MHSGQPDPLAVDLDSLIGYNYAQGQHPAYTTLGSLHDLDLDELSRPHHLLEEIAEGHADTGGWGKEQTKTPGRQLYSKHKKVFTVEEELAAKSRFSEEQYRSPEDEEFEKTVVTLNEQGALELERFDYTESFNHLLLAEKKVINRLSIEPDPHAPSIWILRLLSLTLNNLANHAKTIRDYNNSLKYLSRVLHIEREILDDQQEICSTYLNISAVLFEMGCFPESYQFALQSKDLLVHIDAQQEGDEIEQHNNSVNILQAIYNMGLCLEAQNNISGARECFCRGFSLGVNQLGNSHFMTQKFERKLIGNELNLEASARTPSTDLGYSHQNRTSGLRDRGNKSKRFHNQDHPHSPQQLPNLKMQTLRKTQQPSDMPHNGKSYQLSEQGMPRSRMNMTFNTGANNQGAIHPGIKQISPKNHYMMQQTSGVRFSKSKELYRQNSQQHHQFAPQQALYRNKQQRVYLPAVGSPRQSPQANTSQIRLAQPHSKADQVYLQEDAGQAAREPQARLPDSMHKILRNMVVPKNLPKNLAQTISLNKNAKLSQLEKVGDSKSGQNYALTYTIKRPPISNLPEALLMNYQDKQRLMNEMLSAHRDKSQLKSTAKRKRHQNSQLEMIHTAYKSQRSQIGRSIEPRVAQERSYLGAGSNERSTSLIQQHDRSRITSMHGDSEQRLKQAAQDRLREIFSLDPRRNKNSRSAVQASHANSHGGRPDISDQSLITNTPSRSAHGARTNPRPTHTTNQNAFEQIVLNPDNVDLSQITKSSTNPIPAKYPQSKTTDKTHHLDQNPASKSAQVPGITDFPQRTHQKPSVAPLHAQSHQNKENTADKSAGDEQSFHISSEHTPSKTGHYKDLGRSDFVDEHIQRAQDHTNERKDAISHHPRRSKRGKTVSSDVTEEQQADSRRDLPSDRPRLSMPAAKFNSADSEDRRYPDAYASADLLDQTEREPDSVYETFPRRPKSRKGKRLDSSGSFPMRISEQPIEESADGSKKLHSSIDQIHMNDMSNPEIYKKPKQPQTTHPSAASTPRDRLEEKPQQRKSVQELREGVKPSKIQLLAQKYLPSGRPTDEDPAILIQNTGTTQISVSPQQSQRILSQENTKEVLSNVPAEKTTTPEPIMHSHRSPALAAPEKPPASKLPTARSGPPKPTSSSIQPTPRVPVTNLSQSRPVSRGESIELQMDSIVEPVNTPRDRSEDVVKMNKKGLFGPEYQSAHNIAREHKKSLVHSPNVESAQSASMIVGASQALPIVSNTIVIKDPNLKGHNDSHTGSQMKIYIGGSAGASRRGSNAEASLLSENPGSIAGTSNRAGVHQITFKRKATDVRSRQDLSAGSARTLQSVGLAPVGGLGLKEAPAAKTYNQEQKASPLTPVLPTTTVSIPNNAATSKPDKPVQQQTITSTNPQPVQNLVEQPPKPAKDLHEPPTTTAKTTAPAQASTPKPEQRQEETRPAPPAQNISSAVIKEPIKPKDEDSPKTEVQKPSVPAPVIPEHNTDEF